MGVAESISAVSVAGTVTGLSYTQATAQQRAAEAEGSGEGGGGGESGAGADGPSKGAFPASSSSGFNGGGGGAASAQPAEQGREENTAPASHNQDDTIDDGNASRCGGAEQRQQGKFREGNRRRRRKGGSGLKSDGSLPVPASDPALETQENSEPIKPRHKSNPNRRKRHGGRKGTETGASNSIPDPSAAPSTVAPPSRSSSQDIPPDSPKVPDEASQPQRPFPRHQSNPMRRTRGPRRTMPVNDAPSDASAPAGGSSATGTTRKSSLKEIPGDSKSSSESAGMKMNPREGRVRLPLSPNVSHGCLPASEVTGEQEYVFGE